MVPNSDETLANNSGCVRTPCAGFAPFLRAVHSKLKHIQRKIHDRLLMRCIDSRVAYGGIKGRDHFGAAARHVGKRAIAQVDIKDFFPSISVRMVYDLFMKMGCSCDVARLLAKLLTVKGHVPQGAPASTTLANLVSWRIDRELEALQASLGVGVSRFVDDTVASGQAGAVRRALDTMVRATHRTGFRINRKKTRIQYSGNAQVVTGLSVNRRLCVPKAYRKKVRDAIRQQLRYGWKPRGLESAVGKIAYIARANQRAGAVLKASLGVPPRDGDKVNG